MALNLNYQPFSGVGIVALFTRNPDGSAGAGFDLGEAPGFKTTQAAPVVEMNTSRDVSRGTAFRMAQSKAAGVEIRLKTLDDFSLSLLTSGVWADVAAGSAEPGFVAPAGLVAGNIIKLPHQNVSLVSVVDSTGSPKTLPPAQYEVDAVGGTVKLLNITAGAPYAQPFKVAYTPGAVKVLGGLKAPEKDYIVQLNGTNAYNGERGIFQGYNFRLGAEGDADWISEEFGEYLLRGSLLLDATRTANSAGGQFYSWTKLAA